MSSPQLIELLRERMFELRNLMLISPAANPEGKELLGDTFIRVIIADVLRAAQRGEVSLDSNGQPTFVQSANSDGLAEIERLITVLNNKAFKHWDEEDGTHDDWLYVNTILSDVLSLISRSATV